jgi:hypothetical protein
MGSLHDPVLPATGKIRQDTLLRQTSLQVIAVVLNSTRTPLDQAMTTREDGELAAIYTEEDEEGMVLDHPTSNLPGHIKPALITPLPGQEFARRRKRNEATKRYKEKQKQGNLPNPSRPACTTPILDAELALKRQNNQTSLSRGRSRCTCRH